MGIFRIADGSQRFLPMSHCGGQLTVLHSIPFFCFVIRNPFTGQTKSGIMPGGVSPGKRCSTIRRHFVTALPAVPPLFRILWQQRAKAREKRLLFPGFCLPLPRRNAPHRVRFSRNITPSVAQRACIGSALPSRKQSNKPIRFIMKERACLQSMIQSM